MFWIALVALDFIYVVDMAVIDGDMYSNYLQTVILSIRCNTPSSIIMR